MSALCHKVDAFADGELAPEELPGFENHLVACDRCMRALEAIFAMRGMAETAMDRRAAVTAQFAPPRRRRWGWLSVDLFGVVAAAAAAFVLFAPRPELWVTGPSRPIEPRLEDPRADVFKPYDQIRGEAAAAPASYETLGKLQRDKDVKGLVSRLLLQRQVSEAASFLREGELDNERAVAALLAGKPEEALAPLERTLARTSPGKPGWAQAHWNRALALRELGLARAAAAAFRTVEGLAEPGWSAEAGVWARKLEDQTRDRERVYREAHAQVDRMVRVGEPPGEGVVEAWPDLVRWGFYRALHAPARLAPVARALDAHYGGAYLASASARYAPP